ncbi:hypothetical protein CLV92_11012 [Kineococcus xinjiangensis]|uniref:Uncharacterized protein n=1 Tax=Kineococcus xinjiangensis TaxID=512762 RepID=A0A2S6IGN7_9ACTN|nr:hypothetical protein [Kineococcus xinjiangensis]PPK93384.1 hypothetical protein CLV92_11012 [Kineococcus xinjiangensis]
MTLDALDLVADPPARPLPHGGVPGAVWSAWRARRPDGPPARPLTLTHSRPASAPSPWAGQQPPFDWPDVLVTLHRHLLLPDLRHRVEVAALGATVRLTRLDGAPLALADPAARLRAHGVLSGRRVDLDPGEVLAFALLHAELRSFLAAHPPGGGLDLRLVLAAADVGLSAADVEAAHAAGTLTPDRIEFLAAFQGVDGRMFDGSGRTPA